MYGILLLAALMAYQCAQSAAHDNATLPFQLGSHSFNQHIEQEYKLHVCHRLHKLSRHYPHHAIINMYKELTTTSLNGLIKQPALLEKAALAYAPIQTCPDVMQRFNQAVAESHKGNADAWQCFRATAYGHLQKFSALQLPPLDISVEHQPTQAQIDAYKTWLIVYFAIKQNEHMGKK